jgi:hypothetical protein
MSRLESLLAWDQVRNRATAAARDLCCAATTLQAVLSETYPQDGDVLEDAALLTHQLRCFHLPLQQESIKVAQELERVAVLTAFGLLQMSQGTPHLDAALHLLFRQCCCCCRCYCSSSTTTTTTTTNDKETTLEEVAVVEVPLTNEVDLLLKRATGVHSQDPIYGLVLRSVAHLLDYSLSRHSPCQHDSFKPDWPPRTDPRFLYLRALAITATHEQGVSLMKLNDGPSFEDFTETYPNDFVEFWEQDESQYELPSDRLAIATTDALRVLCRDPGLRRKAAIAGCVAPLARFLHLQRSLTLRPAVAARALGNLVLAGEGCRREAEKYGVVNSLLAMLAGYTTTATRESTANLMVRYAVEALANLAANSKTMQQEILRTKPDLFVFLTHILESQRVVRKSDADDQTNLNLLIATSRLVRNLTSRCPSNRLAAKGSGILTVIAAKIIFLAKEREGNGSVTVDRWLLMALASLCEGCPTAAEEAADVPGLLDALFSYLDLTELTELTECTQLAAVIALSHVLTSRRPLPAGWTMRTVAAALVGILKEVAVAASINTAPEPAQYQHSDRHIQTDGSESLGARAAAMCIDVLADVSNDREAFGRAGAPQVLCDVIIALSGPNTQGTYGETLTPTRAWHPAILGAAIKALCTLLSGRYNANRNLVLASHIRSRRLARVLVGLLDPNKASESKGGQHYKRDVVRVLSMLCWVGSEENGKIDGGAVFVDAVVAAGGIQALVRICNSQREHFKEVAATALSNLACIPDLHSTMLAAECVPPLLSMLSPTSPTPHRRSAACCVANLVAEGTIPPAIRRELSQTVINLVSLSYTGVCNDSSSAAAAAAGALGNLGCAGKSGIDAVLRKGGIEALIRLVGSPSPAVREAAVQGLWDCCRSDSSSRVAAVMARAATRSNSNSNSNSNGQNSAEDLVPALVHALRVAGSLPTAVSATGCLATILALGRSDIREMALRAGARGALMSRTAESFREGFGDSSADMSTAEDTQSTLRLEGGLEDGDFSGLDGDKENLEGDLCRLVAKALRCLSSTNTVERNVEREEVEQVETQMQMQMQRQTQMQMQRQTQLQFKLQELETEEEENSIAAGVKKCFSFDQDSAVSCLVRATS